LAGAGAGASGLVGMVVGRSATIRSIVEASVGGEEARPGPAAGALVSGAVV
jgi:hypothetical protein